MANGRHRDDERRGSDDVRWLGMLLGLILSTSAYAGGLVFSLPSFSLGKPIESAQMHQDAEGAMWFIEVGAIHRFDGRELETYTHDKNAPDGAIAEGHTRLMFNTANGDLWALTGSTLQYFEHASRSWRTPQLPNIQGEIHWADSDDGRRIWLFTERSEIAIYDPQIKQLTPLSLDGDSNSGHQGRWETAVSDGAGGYFALIKDEGVFHLAISGSATVAEQLVYRFPTGQPFDPFKAFYDEKTRRLYLLDASSQLTTIAIDQQREGRFVTSPLSDDQKVYDLLIEDDMIRFLTDKGVETLADGQLSRAVINFDVPESGLNARDLAKSIDGLYWLSSFDEPILVGSVTSGDFLSVLEGDDRFRNLLYMTEDPGGRLIISIAGLVVAHDRETGVDQILLSAGDGSDFETLSAMSLLSTDEFLYIGTLNQGLLRYAWSDGRVYAFPLGAGSAQLNASGVTAIIEHSSGRIIVATNGGGVSVIDGNTVFTPELPVPDNHTALSLIELDDGSVFIPAWDGFLSLDRGLRTLSPLERRFQSLAGESREFPYRTLLWGLTQSRDGTLLSGSTSVGLVEIAIANKRATVTQIDNTVPSPYELLEIEPSQYLVSSAEGILFFDHATQEVTLLEEELQPFEFTQGCAVVHSSGALYFCSTAGPMRFTEVPRVSTHPVKVGLSSVYSSSEGFITASDDSPLTISAEDRITAFRFFAADYLAPSHIRFRYRLRGYHDQWTPLGTDASVALTRMPPGHYLLEVAASRFQGDWNTNAFSLPIRVNPAWWQSWPMKFAYLLVIGLAIVVVFFTYESQKRAFRRLESELRVSLQEQTRKTEIERVNHVDALDALQHFKTQMAELLIAAFAELRELSRFAGNAATREDRVAAIAGLSGAIAKSENRLMLSTGVSAPTSASRDESEPLTSDNENTLIDAVDLVEDQIQEIYGTHYAASDIRIDFIADARIPERVELDEDTLSRIVELLLVGIADTLPKSSSIVVRLYCLEDDLFLSFKEHVSTEVAREAAREYMEDASSRVSGLGGTLTIEPLSNSIGSLIQVELPCRSVIPRELELEAMAIYAAKDTHQAAVISNILLRCGYSCEQWGKETELDEDADVPLFVAVEALDTLVDQTDGRVLEYPNVVLIGYADGESEVDVPVGWARIDGPILTGDIEQLLL